MGQSASQGDYDLEPRARERCFALPRVDDDCGLAGETEAQPGSWHPDIPVR